MKWTIRIELTPDGNEPITRDIGTITRSIADLYPEQVGLTLEEAAAAAPLQMEIITAQHEATNCAADRAWIAASAGISRMFVLNVCKRYSASSPAYLDIGGRCRSIDSSSSRTAIRPPKLTW